MKKDYETFKKKMIEGDYKYLFSLRRRFPDEYENMISKFEEEGNQDIISRNDEALDIYGFVWAFMK